ncbi:hypothetical protein [Parvibaculum sp.]|uniref:hypothetical protein n=1 Tax=Parvibaculum sp. TaxID=2024848 RepID=UPI0026207B35|nr:hypothetical protein [Parvibaculum sp.]MCW5727258.1 hypothetical protein [Parvibaculum sp.]
MLQAPANLPALTGDAAADAAALLRALMLAGPRWELGATGPAAFDCWSMARLIEAHLFARPLADVDARGPGLKGLAARGLRGARVWRERGGRELPAHGDGVLLTRPDERPHVGVFLALDRGLVAHMAEHQGFSADTLLALKTTGYRNPRFFEWRLVAD